MLNGISQVAIKSQMIAVAMALHGFNRSKWRFKGYYASNKTDDIRLESKQKSIFREKFIISSLKYYRIRRDAARGLFTVPSLFPPCVAGFCLVISLLESIFERRSAQWTSFPFHSYLCALKCLPLSSFLCSAVEIVFFEVHNEFGKSLCVYKTLPDLNFEWLRRIYQWISSRLIYIPSLSHHFTKKI